MNINTKDISFVNFNNQVMEWIKFNGVKVWEAFKTLVLIGVPPLTFFSKGEPLIDYKIYGKCVQDEIPTPIDFSEIKTIGTRTENLFNNKHFLINGISSARNLVSTDNGVAFEATATIGQCNAIIGLAKNFIGKTLVFSSPNWYNTAATAFAIRSNTGTHLVGGSNWTKYGDVYYSTITIPNDATYTTEELCLRLYFSNMVVGDIIEYSNIMVTYGDTPVEYVPYGYYVPVNVNENITNIVLNEPLRKIGDYADYIDYENQKVVRKIKSCKLDGTESVSMFTSGNVNYFRNSLQGFTYKPTVEGGTNLGTNGLCNAYKVVIAGSRGNYTLSAGASNLITYDFGNNDFSSVAEFKANSESKFLNDQPIEICIVASETTEESIVLPQIQTSEGTNILDVDTETKPSNMEITYKGKWK